MTKTMKYVDKMICFQEVPDEITLSFSISNCPYHCEGCHSGYLAEDIGTPLLPVIETEIQREKPFITCVLFMGGDDALQKPDLIECAKICKLHNLKTALYSGATIVDEELLDFFDYIKVGPYIKELGGLKDPKTNQRFYENQNGKLIDKTYLFWRKF